MMKTNFLNGNTLVAREEGIETISTTSAKGLVLEIARVTKKSFISATESFQGNSDLDDKFCEVHKEMKKAMFVLFVGQGRPFANNFPEVNQWNIFLKEADLFLGKFVWMVLMHIRSLPSMPGSDEYVNLLKSKSCKKNTDIQKDDFIQLDDKFWDYYYQYKPDFEDGTSIWEKNEGRLPMKTEYLLYIGDIVKLKITRYIDQTCPPIPQMYKISGFERGLYEDSFPIQVKECEVNNERNDITIVPPQSADGKGGVVLTQKAMSRLRSCSIEFDSRTMVHLLSDESGEYEHLTSFLLVKKARDDSLLDQE